MRHLIALLSLAIAAHVMAETPARMAPRTKSIDGEPRGIVMIDKRGNLVRFFDPATLMQTAELSIGGTPHELALSPDRKTAYVPDYGDGVYGNNPHPGHKIAVIDLESKSVRATIDISPQVAPHGLQVDAQGTLYAVCDISRKLLVIDPKKLTIKAAIDTDGTGHWLAVKPDGSKAYVANKNDRRFISVIDLKAGRMVGKIDMPNGTQGIDISPDGKRVLATDFSDPTIAVIDTASDQIVDRIAVTGSAKGAWRASFTPNGAAIAIVSLNDRAVNVARSSSPSEQRRVPVGSQPFGIAFSRDSRTAYVPNHGDGTLTIFDLEEPDAVRTQKVGVGIETLAFY